MSIKVASEYFHLFLREIGCEEIRWIHKDENCFFGFQNSSIDLVRDLLTKLNVRFRIENLNQNKTLIISHEELIKLLEIHLATVIVHCQEFAIGASPFRKKYTGTFHGRGFYFLYPEEYRTCSRDPIAQSQAKKLGLGSGESIKHVHKPVPGVHTMSVVHIEVWEGYLLIEDINAFFAAHGKQLATEAKGAFNLRLYEDLKTMLQPKSFYHEIPIIAQLAHIDSLPPLPIQQLSNEVTPQISPNIEARIQELKNECGCLTFFSSRKRNKIAFLELIAGLQTIHQNLSTKQCVELAIKINKKLYEEAVSGYFSHRTKDLIEELKKDNVNSDFQEEKLLKMTISPR